MQTADEERLWNPIFQEATMRALTMDEVCWVVGGQNPPPTGGGNQGGGNQGGGNQGGQGPSQPTDNGGVGRDIVGELGETARDFFRRTGETMAEVSSEIGDVFNHWGTLIMGPHTCGDNGVAGGDGNGGFTCHPPSN